MKWISLKTSDWVSDNSDNWQVGDINEDCKSFSSELMSN